MTGVDASEKCASSVRHLDRTEIGHSEDAARMVHIAGLATEIRNGGTLQPPLTCSTCPGSTAQHVARYSRRQGSRLCPWGSHVPSPTERPPDNTSQLLQNIFRGLKGRHHAPPATAPLPDVHSELQVGTSTHRKSSLAPPATTVFPVAPLWQPRRRCPNISGSPAPQPTATRSAGDRPRPQHHIR